MALSPLLVAPHPPSPPPLPLPLVGLVDCAANSVRVIPPLPLPRLCSCGDGQRVWVAHAGDARPIAGDWGGHGRGGCSGRGRRHPGARTLGPPSIPCGGRVGVSVFRQRDASRLAGARPAPRGARGVSARPVCAGPPLTRPVLVVVVVGARMAVLGARRDGALVHRRRRLCFASRRPTTGTRRAGGIAPPPSVRIGQSLRRTPLPTPSPPQLPTGHFAGRPTPTPPFSPFAFLFTFSLSLFSSWCCCAHVLCTRPPNGRAWVPRRASGCSRERPLAPTARSVGPPPFPTDRRESR